MNAPRYLENPAYRDSCRFIVEGHALMARGESTLPGTDDEHDRMERAWGELTEEEAERLWGLSADLYMLQGQETLDKPLPELERGDVLRERLAGAVKNNRWEEVLALLRYGPTFLSADQVALLRGQAWQALGHDDVAILFFDYAGKLKPQNPRAQLLQLRTLLKLGRIEEARRRADEYVVEAVAELDGALPAAG